MLTFILTGQSLAQNRTLRPMRGAHSTDISEFDTLTKRKM